MMPITHKADSSTMRILAGYFLLVTLTTLSLAQTDNPVTAQSKNLRFKLPHFSEVGQLAGVAQPGKSISAVWVDYDEDDWLDLFVSNGNYQCNAFYRNLGNGTFAEITQKTGLVDFLWTRYASWLDIDNDGYLDIIINNIGQIQIFKNTGSDSFLNITDTVNFPEGNILGADFNNDGWLDFYISRADANAEARGSPLNLLYKNLQNWHFKEIGQQAGVADETDTMFFFWLDYDQDGFLDLYVINKFNQPNQLFRNNQNETFEDIFSTTGIPESHDMNYWADFNNDGWLDLFIASLTRPDRLYKNNGNGTFTNLSPASGLTFPENNPPNSGFHATWVDFDNDGFMDLCCVIYDSLLVFHNNQNETFTNLPNRAGLPGHLLNFAMVWADYDNDGDLDCYLANKGPNQLFRNEGNDNNWIKIDLSATTSNRDASGARIEVQTESMKQIQYVGLGPPMNPHSRQTLHFGLGQSPRVKHIQVRWPTGMIQDTCQLAVNQKIVLREPASPLFSNVTGGAGLGEEINKSFGAAWIDFDNDNYLDLIVGSRPPLLYKNQTNGQFANVTREMNFIYDVEASGVGGADLNNDGYLDIYLANSVFTPNVLIKNENHKSFVDISRQAGVAGEAICSQDYVFGDFNNDGHLDLFVGNDGFDRLYFNQGKFKFIDVTQQSGINDTLISHCTAGDYDTMVTSICIWPIIAGAMMIIRLKHDGLTGFIEIMATGLLPRWPTPLTSGMKAIPKAAVLAITTMTVTWIYTSVMMAAPTRSIKIMVMALSPM